MALAGKKQYDAMLDVLPAGMVYFAYPVDPTTHWTILGDQSQILHVSLVRFPPFPDHDLDACLFRTGHNLRLLPCMF